MIIPTCLWYATRSGLEAVLAPSRCTARAQGTNTTRHRLGHRAKLGRLDETVGIEEDDVIRGREKRLSEPEYRRWAILPSPPVHPTGSKD